MQPRSRFLAALPFHITALALFLCGFAPRASSQVISYLLPDIAAPGMNSYIEIIGPHDAPGNFGADGLYLNTPADAVRVECLNPLDTSKITIGPLLVSWNGRMVSTQVFVHPDVQPNSDSWQALQPEFVINIRVVVNGQPSNVDRVYLVRPQPAIVATGGGAFGAGALGRRSARGAMIVDSVSLDFSTYTVSTVDTDPVTPGNQGFFPFVLISRGRITGLPGATMTVSSVGKDAGPGGGGGGGNFCDVTGTGANGGGGFTGGGRGGRNGSGVPLSSDIFQEPGVSTGSKVNNTGTSLNGVPGATAPAYEAAGGGTGHPFGLSGVGCNDGGGCNPPGGHGGGSGQQQTRGGGGGGYATAGQTVSAGNGGNAHGNAALVPLAGGSGGAGGNPQGFSVCSGEGGGGGGALRLSATSVTSILMSANGGDGQVRPNGPGGSGSGGAVSIETKLLFETAQLSARGGATSIPGGAGRVRLDGPRNTIVIAPSTASNFRGPSTDTSRYVPRSFVLTGTGDGNRIRLFVKSASIPWTVLGEVSSYTNNAWSFPATLPGTDDVYYLAAAQEVPNPQTGPYTAEPSWVFSQAAANVLVYKAYPRIAGSGALLFDGMLCANERTDTVFVRNDGEGPLELRGATLKPGSAFRLLQPGAFPATIAPHDSLAFVLRCTPPPLATGVFADTLLVANSDTAAVNNPWRIALSARKDSAGLAAVEASVSFPDILLCIARQSDTTVTVVNTGTSLLQVQAPQFSDPSFSLLSPPPSAFPYNLDPVTRTLRVRIRYTPSVAGNTVAGSVTFRTGSAYCDRIVTVPLSGRADSVAVRAAQTLSFRPLLCAGDVADTIWTIENTGTAPVTLAAPVSGDAHFTVPAPPFPLTLAPGEKKDVTVRYTPGAAGADAGVLSTVAQPCGVPLLLAMDGRRDSASLAAAGTDFGLLSTDSLPATRDVVIRNTGSVAITARAAAFRTGTPFSIVSGIPAIVPPGGTATVRVRFTDPGTDGTFSDSLILNYEPGCAAAASLVRGTRGTASITLEIDTVRGAPGELVDVPVYLRSSVNPKLFGATGIRAVFRARADLLSPVSIPSGILSGNDRSIPLSLPLLPDARGVLVTLRFRAMLGMAETSPLLLDSAAGVGGALSITTVPGVFLLTNVCREGGTRLFDGSVKAFLAQNTPNPFNPSTEIEYGIAEAGEMQLAVLDMLGRRVAVLESGLRAPGRYTARFDATGLASGIYLCVLVTPTMTLQRVMTLMK